MVKREISHRDLFVKMGQLEGRQRQRDRYDIIRDKKEDAYRRAVIKKLDKLDSLPKRVASLEATRSTYNMLKQRGIGGWITLKGLTLFGIFIVIIISSGFINGLKTIGGWVFK